ncbi:hypothetical protein, partial [Aggregatibacter actinomycetemcomitans]|uniref:hypothetical protein n=1 Tax=Aggregatibacter actinomycetemcomitans TaxID=714 RepID=UPI00197BB10B
MKKIFLIFISLLFIFSCGNDVKELDNEYLGEIKKNQPYNTVITLPKRKVTRSLFNIIISPNNSGLTWFVKDESLTPGIKNYDNIFIK